MAKPDYSKGKHHAALTKEEMDARREAKKAKTGPCQHEHTMDIKSPSGERKEVCMDCGERWDRA